MKLIHVHAIELASDEFEVLAAIFQLLPVWVNRVMTYRTASVYASEYIMVLLCIACPHLFDSYNTSLCLIPVTHTILYFMHTGHHVYNSDGILKLHSRFQLNTSC